MRIEGIEGEFYFKCLVRCFGHDDGWQTSGEYFSSKEDAQKHYKDKEIKWPVEMRDDIMCYVPDTIE